MSNIGFVGKEGFNWWLGQIPSVNTSDKDSGDNSWALQADGNGWGDRYKVRILGYHPAEESELSDNDLPYALAMLPSTSGTGGGNFAQSTRLRPGDTVIGFFMDGASAQIPVIMGALTRTDDVPTDGIPTGFKPGTGHNKNLSDPPHNNPDNVPTEGAGSTKTAQKTPANRNGKAESKATGLKIQFADTCKESDKTFFMQVIGIIENLLKVTTEATNFLGDVQSATKKLQKLCNNLVGDLFTSLYEELIPLLQDGLDKLYKSVFASTGGNHLAAVAAQEAMIIPLKNMQDGIQCVSAKIINGLGKTIKDLIESTLIEVVNFGVCAAEQFVGSLLNSIIDEISSGLDSLIGGLSKILGPAFKVADFLRSSADVAKKIQAFLSCNQTNEKCKVIPTWTIGYGPKNRSGIGSAMDKAFDAMNVSKALSGISSGTSPYTKPDCGDPSSCGGPNVSFFGGDGIGGAGKAIMGGIVNNTDGLGDVVSSVTRTGSIIGVEITDPGSGYTYAPPIVSFEDSCGLGYGAVGRTIVDFNTGKITGVYIVSEGENYPVEDDEDYTVTDTTVLSPGIGYSPDDTATDDNGNEYSLRVDNGRIISATPINNVKVDTLPNITINTSTGIGALIRPLMGTFTPQGEVISVIDCVT
jgi:hypothetical protein